MKLWKKEVTLEEINSLNRGTIHDSLGITFTRIGDDFLEASMPVDQRTKQPMGLLHGGASVVLAESLGSIASVIVIGIGEGRCVGIEINASHLSSAKSGFVFGRVTAVRIGKTLHVWEIRIRSNEQADSPLVSIARLSVGVR